MDERSQLIENIILSEIKYAEWKTELATAEGARADDLRHFIADDDAVIAQWMANYSITFDDIAAEREPVLRRVQAEKAAEYERRQQDEREQLALMGIAYEEPVQQVNPEVAYIESLISQPNAYL